MINFYAPNDFSNLLEGDPATLESRSGQLSRQAAAINDASRALQDIVSGQLSKSTTALRSTAAELQTSMSQAYLRYDETANALRTYAVALAPIKAQAARDIPALEAAQGRVGTAEHAAGDAQRRQLFEVVSNSPEDVRQDTADDLARANRQAAAAQAEVSAILARLRAGAQHKEEAAQAAIRAIENVISQGKDSVLDNIAQFFEGIGNFLASIGKWIADVVKKVVDAIVDIVQRLVSILVMVVLIVAAIALVGIVLLLVAAIPIVGPILAGLIGVAILAAPAIIGGILLNIAIGESLAPDPKPIDAKYDDSRKPLVDKDGNLILDKDGNPIFPPTADTYGDLFREVGVQDGQGGTETTEIKVVKIYDENGKLTGVRVQLPSTQSWSPFADHGALNDLRADAMIALMPGLRSQYERAVIDAMNEAGLANTDVPIQLTGWSLGGMMAGELASSPDFPYADRVTSIVTAGSAVDKYRSELGPDVRVTQFNNPFDPVHRLEMVGLGPGDAGYNPKWTTYHPPFIDMDSNGKIHDATVYGRVADQYAPTVHPDDSVFFTPEGGHEESVQYSYTRNQPEGDAAAVEAAREKAEREFGQSSVLVR